jgi:hypothetical protein
MMMCLLTERRLKPGSFDRFRAAWEPDEQPESLLRAYHLRDETDPDHVVSFGLFDLDRADFERLRRSPKLQEMQRARYAAMAEFVAETGLDAVFEVIEVIEGPAATRAGGETRT